MLKNFKIGDKCQLYPNDTHKKFVKILLMTKYLSENETVPYIFELLKLFKADQHIEAIDANFDKRSSNYIPEYLSIKKLSGTQLVTLEDFNYDISIIFI